MTSPQQSSDAQESQPEATLIRPPQTGHPAWPSEVRSSHTARSLSSSETPPPGRDGSNSRLAGRAAAGGSMTSAVRLRVATALI